jgi:hypothetical protein
MPAFFLGYPMGGSPVSGSPTATCEPASLRLEEPHTGEGWQWCQDRPDFLGKPLSWLPSWT